MTPVCLSLWIQQPGHAEKAAVLSLVTGHAPAWVMASGHHGPVIIPALTWRQVMVRWDCSDTESARNSVQASHTPSPVTPWPELHTTHWAPLSC